MESIPRPDSIDVNPLAVVHRGRCLSHCGLLASSAGRQAARPRRRWLACRRSRPRISPLCVTVSMATAPTGARDSSASERRSSDGGHDTGHIVSTEPPRAPETARLIRHRRGVYGIRRISELGGLGSKLSSYSSRVRKKCLEDVGHEVDADENDGGNTQDPSQEILAHDNLRVSFGMGTLWRSCHGVCRQTALFDVGVHRRCASRRDVSPLDGSALSGQSPWASTWLDAMFISERCV
jgi:hypothetical protein